MTTDDDEMVWGNWQVPWDDSSFKPSKNLASRYSYVTHLRSRAAPSRSRRGRRTRRRADSRTTRVSDRLRGRSSPASDEGGLTMTASASGGQDADVGAQRGPRSNEENDDEEGHGGDESASESESEASPSDDTSDGDDRDARDGENGAAACVSAAAGLPMSQGEDGTLACSICLEPTAVGGPHQVSSLACGHCFGHACIFTWLDRKKRGNGGKCPQCNRRAKVADIRKLFVPHFKSFVDTAELDETRKELAKERAGRIEAEADKMRISARLKKIEADLAEERKKLADLNAAHADAIAAAKKSAVSAARSWSALLPPSVGNKRKIPAAHDHPTHHQRDDDRPGRRTVLGMFDPNREEVDAREMAVKSAERERRRALSLRGRYVLRHTARVSGGRAFDVNGTMAAVSESVPGQSANAARLVKVSLSAPSSRCYVRLPESTGVVRDVRLTSGSNGAAAAHAGAPQALVASLGKRLTVVDLYSDAVVASVRLPGPAWSCAWGGWSTPPPSADVAAVCGAPSSTTGNAAADPNLVSVGLAGGDVLMYDLRWTAAAVSSFRATHGGLRASAVHTVTPVDAAAGGGVLVGTLARAYHWRPRVSADAAEGERGAMDPEGHGWLSPIPHVQTNAVCTSLSWAPGSQTVAVSSRETCPGLVSAAGSSDVNLLAKPACHTIIKVATKLSPVGEPRHASISDAWCGPDEVSYATGHLNKAVMSRAALLRPNVKGEATFLASADETHNCVAVWRAGDGALIGRLPAHVGSGHRMGGVGGGGGSGAEIFDVRSWCGQAGGNDEVLASLSRDTLQICSWHPETDGGY